MGLHTVYGHKTLRARLADGIASGRFPQVAMLQGPSGVGKQRLALWVAQGLLCENGPGTPCDTCHSCKLALNLSHPDVHWFFPISRPKATDRDKQVDEAQELLGNAVLERGRHSVYGRLDGMLGHPLASMRLLRRKVSVKPYSARIKVIIIGNAERLVVQESSQESANSLLKVLEEPPDDTSILLTTSRPGSILPTIRSRMIPIRVGRLSDKEVMTFIRNEIPDGPTGGALDKIVLLAEGSPGNAIARIDESSQSGGTADRFLDAVARGPVAWVGEALAQPTYAARGAFSEMLDDVAIKLREKLKDGASDETDTKKALEALGVVAEIREGADSNINPQLATAALALKLEKLL